MLGRIALFVAAWAAMAAWWLLLVDLTLVPELLLGAGTATVAAIGVEVARRGAPATEVPRLRWALRLWRPLLALPRDVAIVSAIAFVQLVRPKGTRGRFRTVRFDAATEEPHDRARRALAEAAGSVAPNTVIVGVDPDTRLLLAHQLSVRGGATSLDPMELG